MTHMEEIRWMPRDVCCEVVTTILLASADRYYVYSVECDAKFDAGSILQEVYEGLRKFDTIAILYGCEREELDPYIETNSDSILHFLDYRHQNRILWCNVVPFIARFPINWEGSLEESENVKTVN
jgi:hypothetical protein